MAQAARRLSLAFPAVAVLSVLALLPARPAAAAPSQVPGAIPARATLPVGQLGTAVAVSGPVAVVGAPGAHKSGAAAVFMRSAAGAWRLRTTLADPGHRQGDFFGDAVAVSGSTVLVGAPVASYQSHLTGLVYVYGLVNGTWRLRGKITDPDNGVYDEFGGSVSVSGTTAVIGAADADAHAGAAFVFTRQAGGTWALQATLTNPTTAQDSFGTAVATSGTIVVVGAPDADNISGMAYVFARSESGWQRQAALSVPHHVTNALFGWSVSASLSTVAVAAEGMRNSAGAVYLFTRSGVTWRRQQKVSDPAGFADDSFGYSVSIVRNRLIVGAPQTSAYRCGSSYEYTRSAGTWRRRAKLVNPGCSKGDLFGWSVALSGRTAVIGAPGERHGTGAAYQQVVP